LSFWVYYKPAPVPVPVINTNDLEGGEEENLKGWNKYKKYLNPK
jgi:hypothetical protein